MPATSAGVDGPQKRKRGARPRFQFRSLPRRDSTLPAAAGCRHVRTTAHGILGLGLSQPQGMVQGQPPLTPSSSLIVSSRMLSASIVGAAIESWDVSTVFMSSLLLFALRHFQRAKSRRRPPGAAGKLKVAVAFLADAAVRACALHQRVCYHSAARPERRWSRTVYVDHDRRTRRYGALATANAFKFICMQFTNRLISRHDTLPSFGVFGTLDAGILS